MIKNFNSLANTGVKKKALKILDAGLTAAQPKNFLKEFIKKNYIQMEKNRIFLSDYKKIFVVAYGKAADSMAEYVSKRINVSQGVIVIPKNTKSLFRNKKFRTFYSGHPLPDRDSVRAGKTVLEFINNRSRQDFVLFLVIVVNLFNYCYLILFICVSVFACFVNILFFNIIVYNCSCYFYFLSSYFHYYFI